MTKSPSRPVLRWHGGKWRLAPWIIAHFPPHRVYVEPFGGAASVLLRKPRSRGEVYNDLDETVVGLFRVLQTPDMRDALIGRLRVTPFARMEFDRARSAGADPVERAWALVVRCFQGRGTNAHSRSTGFRANSMRSNTSPANEWANYPDALLVIAERFRGVVIEHRDARAVMKGFDGADTLHYVDPPYVASTRDRGRDYAHEMDEEGHESLLMVLKALTGLVVLSGYPNALYDEMLRGWRRVETAALADGARPRTEALWINPAASAAIDRAKDAGTLFAGAAK